MNRDQLKVGDHGVFWIDGSADWRFLGVVTALTDTHVTIGANTEPVELARVDRFERAEPVNSWD